LWQTGIIRPMLRITPSESAAGAKKYFGDSLTRSDYYIDGQEVAGRWHGKTAERLGLSGEVKEQDYFALCDNVHPRTGERITPPPERQPARRFRLHFFRAQNGIGALRTQPGRADCRCVS